MKKTVFFRSALRQPIRSLFILLLVGVITFSFAARVGEYLLISREQEELTGYYRSVGYLISTGGGSGLYLSDEVINYLEQSPYVDFIDQRLSVSGVIQDGYYNGNVGLFSTSRTMRDPDAEIVSPWQVYFYGIYERGSSGQYVFTVDEVISGYPEYVTPGKTVYLLVDREAFGDRYAELETGKRYLLRASQDPEALQALGRPAGTDTATFSWLSLALDLPWFLPAADDVDLSQPEYALLASEIQQSHDNACALDLTATADMSIIPAIQSANDFGSRFYLVDGRWLDHEDDLAGNRVIVIHEGLASARDLKVGDTVTLTLRDTSYEYDGHYYTDGSGYLYELQPIGYEFPSRTETFEIVGIYNHTSSSVMDAQLRSSVYQWAYIPLSAYPQDFPPALSNMMSASGSYTLVLTSPEHEEAFQDAALADLAAMGYSVTFVESGYRAFKSATEGIDSAARSNAVIFAVILAVCLCLASFVYFRFRRRDLAISRALGVPVGRCVTASALPLAVIGCVGIVGGSVLAWRYTQANADSLLSSLTEAAGAKGAGVALSMTELVKLDLILVAALLVLTLVFAWMTAKRPVLSQIQGGRNKK